MKKIFYSLLIVALYSTQLSAIGLNDGSSCANAYSYTANQDYDFTFQNGQTDLYIEFTATHANMVSLISFWTNPYVKIDQIDWYEFNGCSNMNLLTSDTVPSYDSTITYLAAYNLMIGYTYLVVLKRNPLNGNPYAKGRFRAKALIITTCPLETELHCGELMYNNGFNYTTTDPVSYNHSFRSEICNWREITGNPSHKICSGNYFAQISCGYDPSFPVGNRNGTDAIGADLAVSVNNGEGVHLQADISKVYTWTGFCSNNGTLADPPDFVYFYLAKSTDVDNLNIPYNTTGVYNNLSKFQEVGKVSGNSLTTSFQNFSLTTTANDTYDRLIVFAEINSTTATNLIFGHAGIDNVFLQKYIQVPDGSDVTWFKNNISSGSSSVSDKTFYIEGELIIDDDFTFNNCNFIMEEDAKITVNQSDRLTIKNTDNTTEYIKSCDPNLFWDGIYVDGEIVINNQTSPSTNTSIDFSNASNGIVINSLDFYLLENIDFDRNNQAIEFEATGNINQFSTIKGCSFQCSSPLINSSSQSYYPSKAVNIINTSSTNLLHQINFDSDQGGKTTHFYGTGGGIYAENSHVQVYRSNFSQFNNFAGGFGSPTVCENAIIISNNTTSPKELKVYDCGFYDNRHCVNAGGDLEINVTNNIVNGGSMDLHDFMYVGSNDEAIYFLDNSIDNVNYAFYGTKVSEVTIEDNTIDLETQSGTTYINKLNKESVAININNYRYTGAVEDILIKDNTVKHSKIGIMVSYAKAEIKNNEIFDLNDHFNSGSCPPFPQCPYTPADGIIALNSQNGVTIEANKIALDPSHYTSSPQTDVRVTGVSLVNSNNVNNIASEVNCNTTYGTGIGLNFEGSNEAATNVERNYMKDHFYGFVLSNNGYIGDVGSNGFAADNEWRGSYGFSQTFADNSNGGNCKLYVRASPSHFDPTIAPIHQSNGIPITKDNSGNVASTACTPPQLRQKGGSIINKPKAKGITTQSLIQRKPAYMVHASDSAIRLSRQLLYWQLAKDSVSMTDSLWLSFADSVNNTVLGKMRKKNTLAVSRQNLDHFDSYINDVQLILEKIDQDSILTVTDSSTLFKIADLCPYYDGIAVYLARGVLQDLGYPYVVNPCEMRKKITVPQKRLAAYEDSEGNSFAIYPNPSRGEIQFKYRVKEDQEVVFQLFDVVGKKQYEESLTQGEFHQLQINELHPAVYFYRLLFNGTLSQSGKLILQ